jgi:hypothetical protein
MEKISFGTLRFIELYMNTDDELIHSFDSYIESFLINEKMGNADFNVIGSVNGMEPLFKVKRTAEEYVAAYKTAEDRLIKISNSEAELIQIITKISEIWQQYPDEMFLPRNTKTVSFYRQFIDYIKSIPQIEFWYWIDFAFKELDIRFEV